MAINHGNTVLAQLRARYESKIPTSMNPCKEIWLQDLNEPNKYIKQYIINEADEDLLALSATWYRLRQELGHVPNVESLISPELFRKVTEVDRVEANAIRDHYSKQFMLWALKEISLTKFREDLRTYITSPGNIFTEETLPMVYRLPEFYHYDLEFTEMKKGLVDAPSKMLFYADKSTKLYPVKYLPRKIKKVPQHEYWFKDDNQYPFLITVDHITSTGLRTLWDREFRLPFITINVKLAVNGLRNEMSFINITKFEIE